jgi:hypothetical protein
VKSTASLIPNVSQPTSRTLILESAKTDGRLERLWALMKEAKAHPVADLPRKGKKIDDAAGVTLPRDLVDMLDDVVFRTQPRDHGIRLLTLDRQAKQTTSRTRSLQFASGPSSACIDWIYFQFYGLDQNGLPSYDDGNPLMFQVYVNLPICLEFDPNWLANLIANLQPVPASGGTSAGCALYASNCYMIPGDDSNITYYNTGEGGTFTVDAAYCQQGPGGLFTSLTDNLPCSPWQMAFYFGQYTGLSEDVALLSLLPDYQVFLAMQPLSSFEGPLGVVPTAGHLYLMLYQKATTPVALPGCVPTDIVPALFIQPLQAGPQNPPPNFGMLVPQQYPIDLCKAARLPLPVPTGAGALFFWNQMKNVNVPMYLGYVQRGTAPQYGPFNSPQITSNTYITALIAAANDGTDGSYYVNPFVLALDCGVSLPAISSARHVFGLGDAMYPYGHQNGGLIKGYFEGSI